MKGSPLIIFNYSVKNQANNTADIFIDGDIVDAPTQEVLKNWFGDDTSTSYKSFRDLVNNSEANVFNVYINSGGGQVTEAMAIHDLLVDLQGKGKTVNTIGRGIIASAATYILMAGNKPQMSSNSWLMIHNVSGFIYGNVNEIENYAVTMRKFNDKANEFYQKTTGLSKTVIANMMDAETWMTADDAKAKGFIAETTGEAKFSQKIKPEQWPYSNSAVLNSYNSFTSQKNTPDMETSKITEAINNGFTALLEKLGISNKKDDAETQKAFKDFSESITNAISENATPAMDETAVTKIVNTAVENALKTVPENFTKAITESQKDFVKKDDIKNLVSKDDIKDVLNKTDFNAEMKTLKDDVIQKISTGNIKNEEDPKKKKATNSKWSYDKLWNEPAKN